MGVGSVLNLQDHYEVNITIASVFHKKVADCSFWTDPSFVLSFYP
jgi:hypothetical protein